MARPKPWINKFGRVKEPRASNRQGTAGFSLIELTVVVTILGFMASVLIPSTRPYAEATLDAGTGEISAAIRFARQEAMRVGQYRAIRISADTGQVSVGTPDLTGGEVKGLASLAYNPSDKRPFDFTLKSLAAVKGAALAVSNLTFTFRNQPAIATICLFDGNGNPVTVIGGRTSALTSGVITLASGSSMRSIAVSMVGRVTFQ